MKIAAIVLIVVLAISYWARFIFAAIRLNRKKNAMDKAQLYLSEKHEQKMVYVDINDPFPDNHYTVFFSPEDSPSSVFCVDIIKDDNRYVIQRDNYNEITLKNNKIINLKNFLFYNWIKKGRPVYGAPFPVFSMADFVCGVFLAPVLTLLIK